MIDIIAHRGYSGKYPENTMTAFKAAERSLADGIEMDVRFTKDKQLVVIHDETVNLKDLKKLDYVANHSNYFKKEEILTLKEHLDLACETNLMLNIEIKYSKNTYFEYESDILNILANYNLNERLIISSFNPQGLAKIAQLAPEIKLGLLYTKKISQPDEYIKKYQIDALHPSKKIAGRDAIALAEKNQIPIRIFTINTSKEIKKYLKMNCTAIITDYPEQAIEIRNKLSNY